MLPVDSFLKSTLISCPWAIACEALCEKIISEKIREIKRATILK